MVQEPSSEFLLVVPGIQHRVSRRTLATHPALMIQSPVVAPPAKGRTAEERDALADPASELPWGRDAATVGSSGLPTEPGHAPGAGGPECVPSGRTDRSSSPSHVPKD